MSKKFKPSSILDPRFEYVPAVETDIRKTFAKVRAEQALLDRMQVRAEELLEARREVLRTYI